jgi:predicted nucleic acid-binding protein
MHMDVYVESNFVLELALLQEQHESCEKIIGLCETGKARLILPAYSLIEPYETTIRYAKERTKLSNELDKEIRQLSRSKPYQEQIDAMQDVIAFLVRSQEDEKGRLRKTLDKLLTIATVIPLKSEIISSALTHQATYDLSPQDSIVYASVLDHLRGSAPAHRCFLNRNSKDFDDPDIVDTLKNLACKMLFSFDHGYNFIASQIGA